MKNVWKFIVDSFHEYLKKPLIFVWKFIVDSLIFVLSPTRCLAAFLKSKKPKDEVRDFIIKLNWGYLIITLIVAFFVGIIGQCKTDNELIIFIIALCGYYALSRVNEVFIAFIQDATSHLKKTEHSSSLKYFERIPLAMRSYLELIVLYGIITFVLYSLLPSSMSCGGKICCDLTMCQAIYYSGVTITTLGYGEITPSHFISQFMAIYEVINGFSLIVVSFAVYVSRSISDEEYKKSDDDASCACCKFGTVHWNRNKVKYMETMNIFMNFYKQPENKLTYNFLCLIKHMENQKDFCEFLIDNEFKLSESAVIEVKPQFSDQAGSIPDGKILLRTNDDRECHLFFENKTHRMKLDKAQLERHLETHCQNENALLLVITPRDNDKGIVDSLNEQYDNKILFKTWHQVADKLEHLPSFLAKQFVEYLCWEFEYMNKIISTEINYCCDYFKTNIHLRIQSILRKMSDIEFAKYGLSDVKSYWDDEYGRMGKKFLGFKRKKYGQWFFYGIYYNTKNHGISFIKKGVPELAFFFDIDPKNREKLLQNDDFKRALGNLETLGFEENLTKTRTTNEWRLLFKRVPLTELGNFSYPDVKKRFEEILSQLRNEEAFYQEMMAPPE
jgi:voltage-gated potassium channel